MEKSGVTKIFSTTHFLPVTSLSNNNCCQDPALDADWSSNPTHIATSLGGRILHWNLNALRWVKPDYIFYFILNSISTPFLEIVSPKIHQQFRAKWFVEYDTIQHLIT